MANFVICLILWSVFMVEATVAADGRLKTFKDVSSERMRAFAENASLHMIERSRSGDECRCGYHACGDDFIGLVSDCVDLSVAKEFHNCAKSEECTPVKLYFRDAFLRSPPEQKLDFSSKDHSMEAMINEICLLQSLTETDIFQIASEIDLLDGKRDGFKGWIYFGTPNGMMTTFPGNVRDRYGSDHHGASCEPFDPTLRPWFGPAMSARKAVVILVDESATEQAKRIVAKVLTTLTYSDKVSVLVCNSERKEDSFVYCDGDAEGEHVEGSEDDKKVKKVCFQDGSEENAQGLKDLLDQGSVASLVPAFEHAFKLLKGIEKDEADKMILFIASDTFSPETTEDVLQAVELQQDPDDKVSVLGYSFDTQNSDDGLARQLSCENYGVSMNVDASADMTSYFSFISLAAEHAEKSPSYVHFTPSYVDSDHLGLVITTSMAMYEEFNCSGSSGQKRRFLGVGGIDIKVQVLKDAGLMEEYNSKLNETERLLSIWRNVTELECQLQILREKTGTECAMRLDRSEMCFRIGEDKHYFMEGVESVTAAEAEKKCEELGGKLASPNSMQERAYFASVVPRWGAWIQLEDMDTSEILWSQDFWGNRGQGKGECTKIDPRGRTNNIVRHSCEEKLPYVCQFEKAPKKCEGSDFDLEVEVEDLDAAKCKLRNECEALEIPTIKPPKGGPLCNWPPYSNSNNSSRLGMRERVCCSNNDFNKTCVIKVDPPALKKRNTSIWGGVLGDVLGGILGGVIFILGILLLWSLFLLRRWKSRPPQPIPISTNLLTKETRLGSGFSGVVVRALWENKPVAMKTFYYPDRQDAKNELIIFRKLPLHANIIGCLGVLDGNEEGTVTLILELMHMNLEDFISDCTQHRGISYKELLQVFFDVASGLDHLHKHNFLHLDLKPRNILINLDHPDSRPTVKLCDFGLSIECVTNSINLAETRGTPGYIANEIQRYSFDSVVKATRKADIYSLGMIMHTCLVSKSDSSSELRGSWETLDGIMPLIQSCTHWDPAKRPNAREVCTSLKILMKKDWANRGVYDQPSSGEAGGEGEADLSNNTGEGGGTTDSTTTDASRSEVLGPFARTDPPSRSWIEQRSPPPLRVTISVADPETVYNDAVSDFQENPEP
ncbi:hypothetical protein BSKO_12989 [Bryopsis sp. KO-2023]|nr:hypothetical protein BSKO_12989 [Bryopsis sp. KO-2023]